MQVGSIAIVGLSMAIAFAIGWIARRWSDQVSAEIAEPVAAPVTRSHTAPSCDLADSRAPSTVPPRSTRQTEPGRAPDELVRAVRHALENDNLSLFYQPKLSVRENTFAAAEALLRSDAPALAKCPIDELVLAAEQSALIEDLTLWTLRRALSDQLALIEQGIDIKTFVNLSAKLLSDSEFTLRAVEILKSAQGRIGIEVTETSVIDRPAHALANLELYRMAGAEIAIDDYGVGLSSLRYLKQIPANELKIDREFIKDITESHRDPMIVRSSIDLAHALGMQVTAEGVDCATKLALLTVMGCDHLQGFHIARPMPLAELPDFLRHSDDLLSALKSNTSLLATLASKSA